MMLFSRSPFFYWLAQELILLFILVQPNLVVSAEQNQNQVQIQNPEQLFPRRQVQQQQRWRKLMLNPKLEWGVQNAPRLIGYVLDHDEFQNVLDLGQRFVEGQIFDELKFPPALSQFQPAFEQVLQYMLKLFSDVFDGKLENIQKLLVQKYKQKWYKNEQWQTNEDLEKQQNYPTINHNYQGYIRYEIQQLAEGDQANKRAADFSTSQVHTDNYYQGAIYFIASNSKPFGTTVFDSGTDLVGKLALPYGIYMQDWTGFHSSKPFCAGRGKNDILEMQRLAKSTIARRAIRTFFRVWFWHPLLTKTRYRIRSVADLLGVKLWDAQPSCPVTARVEECFADSKTQNSLQNQELQKQFDPNRQCHVCCNMNDRELAVTVGCWQSDKKQNKLSYEYCCQGEFKQKQNQETDEKNIAPIQNQWINSKKYSNLASTGQHKDNYWGYDYYLMHERHLSNEQCGQICIGEGTLCGGHTWLPPLQPPLITQLPLSLILVLRGTCLIRGVPKTAIQWQNQDAQPQWQQNQQSYVLQRQAGFFSGQFIEQMQSFQRYPNADVESDIISDQYRFVESERECMVRCMQSYNCYTYTWVSSGYEGDPLGRFSDAVYMKYMSQRCVLKSRYYYGGFGKGEGEGNGERLQEDGNSENERGSDVWVRAQMNFFGVNIGSNNVADRHLYDQNAIIPGAMSEPRRQSLTQNLNVKASHSRPINLDFGPLNCFQGSTWKIDLGAHYQIDELTITYPPYINEEMTPYLDGDANGTTSWNYEIFLLELVQEQDQVELEGWIDFDDAGWISKNNNEAHDDYKKQQTFRFRKRSCNNIAHSRNSIQAGNLKYINPNVIAAGPKQNNDVIKCWSFDPSGSQTGSQSVRWLLFEGDLRFCQVEVWGREWILWNQASTKSKIDDENAQMNSVNIFSENAVFLEEDLDANALWTSNWNSQETGQETGQENQNESQQGRQNWNNFPTPPPWCDETLILRTSFVELYHPNIRYARDECETTHNFHYHYMNAHILINGMSALNMGMCLPKSYQSSDPLWEDSYCPVEWLIEKHFSQVEQHIRIDSVRLLHWKRFWPDHWPEGRIQQIQLGQGQQPKPQRQQRVSSFSPDTTLNFLIAGFARSGTTSLSWNLKQHPEIAIGGFGADTLGQFGGLSFNWPWLIKQEDVDRFREEVWLAVSENKAKFDQFDLGNSERLWIKVEDDIKDASKANTNSTTAPPNSSQHDIQHQQQPPLVGHKSEGFAFSRHVEYVCKHWFPDPIKLIFMLREPIEWLQSIYNLRVHLRCEIEGVGSPGCQNDVQNDFLGVWKGDKEWEDVGRQYGKYSEVLGKVFEYCGGENILLLEFEELKKDPRAVFDKITDFLGVQRFEQSYKFVSMNEGDKRKYNRSNLRNILCDQDAEATSDNDSDNDISVLTALNNDKETDRTQSFKDDLEAFNILKEYYKDEYRNITELLGRYYPLDKISEKMKLGAIRSSKFCKKGFFKVNSQNALDLGSSTITGQQVPGVKK